MLKKTLLTILFILFFVPIAVGAQQQSPQPTFQQCVNDGGYNKATKVWKNIPQCEQLRWGYAQHIFHILQAYRGISLSKRKMGVNYHCNDFAAAQDQTSTGSPPNDTGQGYISETAIKQCVYGGYNSQYWTQYSCSTIHLPVCKYIFEQSGLNQEDFIKSSSAQDFHCYEFSQSEVAGSTGSNTGGNGSAAGGGAGNQGGAGGTSGSTGATGSNTLATLQKQCETYPFLSSPWLLGGCRDVQKDKVKQYCASIDSSNSAWTTLNCPEFSNGQGVIGSGGSQSTNPFGVSSGSSSSVTGNAGGTTSVGASCSAKFKSITDIFGWIRCLIGILIPLGLSIAFIVFMWNVIRYVIAPNPTKDNERGKYIMWALIGLFVLVAVWGIVALVTSTFGLGFAVPQLPTK